MSKFNIHRAYLLPTLTKIGPPSFRRFIVDMFPSKALHDLRDMADVLHRTTMEIYNSKKASLEAGEEVDSDAKGKDIMSILCG